MTPILLLAPLSPAYQISLGDSRADALVMFTDLGFNVVGVVARTFTNGDGFSYTLIYEDIPHVKDED